MNNQLQETVQRIAREITAKNVSAKSWDGNERRKQKRDEIYKPNNPVRCRAFQDRRAQRSVFAGQPEDTFRKEYSDENHMESASNTQLKDADGF